MTTSTPPRIHIVVATEAHHRYAQQIVDEMASSASVRGTGIAKRTPEFVRAKMSEGKAVIAIAQDGRWAGFCYIESWSHGRFVANSGLIVHPDFRRYGLGRRIKTRIFELSRTRFPRARIFGLTTGRSVMRMNSALGYEPVTYSELTNDPQFWAGCRSCPNYAILESKSRKTCLCTAMLYDPQEGVAKRWKGRKWHAFLAGEVSEIWRAVQIWMLGRKRKRHADTLRKFAPLTPSAAAPSGSPEPASSAPSPS